MKQYIKPSIEYIELRAEESLAASPSNPGFYSGPNPNGIENGVGIKGENKDWGKGYDKP